MSKIMLIFQQQVNKYIVPSEETSYTDRNLLKLEEKLRKLETQIQQLNNASTMKLKDVS